jgi:hypothetical protein
MIRKEAILILRTIGNFLVLFAIFGIIATFGPALYYEINFRIAEARGIHYVVSSELRVQNSEVTKAPSSELPKTQNTGIADFAQVLAGSESPRIDTFRYAVFLF